MTLAEKLFQTQAARMDAALKLAAMHPSLLGLTRETFELFGCMHKAHMRVVEMNRPDALIDDPYAKVMAGEAGPVQWGICGQGGNLDDAANLVVLRTRLTDEFLRNKPSHIKQIVFLGDGSETRAFRMRELHDCHVFELRMDRPSLDYKDKVFRSLRIAPVVKARDAFLVDLKTNAWMQELQARGFEPHEPTYWFVEGLISHLDEQTNRQLLQSIDQLSARGSKLWTDVAGIGTLEIRTGKHNELVLAGRDVIDYGEDATIFCGLQWTVELLVRRNQVGEYYGTKWDEQLYARLRVPQELVRIGPFFFALFTKP